jgi:hypothetical protein
VGEGPSGPQAVAWLDCKRLYFMRPQLGRVYVLVADPTPFADALAVLGFEPFPEPVSIGDGFFHLAALEFGPQSVEGWLSRLAAAELGIADRGFLDAEDRTVDLGEQRIQLSPLEFGVLATLSERPGRAVTRAELIEQVWGTTYVGEATSLMSSSAASARNSGRYRTAWRPRAASATASSSRLPRLFALDGDCYSRART